MWKGVRRFSGRRPRRLRLLRLSPDCGKDRGAFPLERLGERSENVPFSAMSSNIGAPPVPPYSQSDSLKPIPIERKGPSSNPDIEARGNSQLPPRYKHEEYPWTQGRTSLRRSTVAHVARSFIALILMVAFLVSMPRSWCGRMGFASKLTDTSRLLSNGTHEFKRTVLIVSFDGLR